MTMGTLETCELPIRVLIAMFQSRGELTGKTYQFLDKLFLLP